MMKRSVALNGSHQKVLLAMGYVGTYYTRSCIPAFNILLNLLKSASAIYMLII